MFIPKINYNDKVFTYGKLYQIKNYQNFVYLVNGGNFDTIKGVKILDVGVKFEYNEKIYKIIRIDDWLGITMENT